jgi:hypothetical protein
MIRISKQANCSTSHIPQTDEEYLIDISEGGIANNIAVDLTPFGFVVMLMDKERKTVCENSISDAFWNIVDLARQHDCDSIKFDRDEKIVEFLPIHDWEE